MSATMGYSKNIISRVTEEDYYQLWDVAGHQGKSLSQLIRYYVMSGLMRDSAIMRKKVDEKNNDQIRTFHISDFENNIEENEGW